MFCLISDVLYVIQYFTGLWQEGKNEFQLCCLGQKRKSVSYFFNLKKDFFFFIIQELRAVFFHIYKN